MSLLEKPSYLNDDYHLRGPKRLHITGPLSQARNATIANLTIREIAGPTSEWWPNLDMSLFFLGGSVPSPVGGSVQSVRDDDTKRLREDYSRFNEVMFVNQARHVDMATAFKIGRSIATTEVETTYYLGKESSLGDLERLAASGDIVVLDDPIGVFRWETSEGFLVRATQQVLAGSGSREAIK